MSENVKHLHVRNPSKPCYNISLKGIIKILESEGGIAHIYAPRVAFRLRATLTKDKKDFIRKRLGREHWVFCLAGDIHAKKHIEEMVPDEEIRFDAKKATEELINEKFISVPIERAASVSKAYYSSDFFKRTQKSIVVKSSSTREFMDISLF